MERKLGGWNEDLQANISCTRVGLEPATSGDISTVSRKNPIFLYRLDSC